MTQTEKNIRTKVTTETLKIKGKNTKEISSQGSENIISQSQTHRHTHGRGKAKKMTAQYTEEKDQERLKEKMVY